MYNNLNDLTQPKALNVFRNSELSELYISK